MFKLIIFLYCMSCGPAYLPLEYPYPIVGRLECHKQGLLNTKGTDDLFICIRLPDAASNDVQMGEQVKGRVSY